MSEGTLYDEVWERHKVAELPDGRDQLFVGLHLVHEVTSPQAFGMLRERDLEVAFPERTVATTDHVVPTATTERDRPLADDQAETMLSALEENVADAGVRFFGLGDERQGITHVVAPEQGLTRPGMTVACGDSHTATHGAVGAIGVGIGTSQIRDVLATGCIAAEKRDVRRIEVTGSLDEWVTAKDLIVTVIRRLGVDGGVGYVYEYGGEAIRELDVESRLALCNMSIEGGARAGYVEPDETTVEYLRGRPFAPEGEAFEERAAEWLALQSDDDATYDDVVEIDADAIQPTVTWGTTPAQAVGVDEPVPDPADLPDDEAAAAREAQAHTGATPGEPMRGTPVDVAFLGTCTNGRASDFRAAARVLTGGDPVVPAESAGDDARAASDGGVVRPTVRHTVPDDVRAVAVPGSERVRARLEAEGVDEVFRAAGFEWRQAGCSMCLAMNGDELVGDEVCVSASNRNYVGRQGSTAATTVLASPATVAASAVTGAIVDPREVVA
ncbi:aconitase family protein [Halobaculum sp. MBLA0147]|uniref:aconitase family protein n=1 Tax=Halobaculum sp. MBLA0147 TaxID=3079934 RepID=UPI003526B923